MRRFIAAVLVLFAVPLFGQRSQRPRYFSSPQPAIAEQAVKTAMDALANEKKLYDRDLSVLQHIVAADEALGDTMQPNNAIQKALDEMTAAKVLMPEFVVMQGVDKAYAALEDARRSPFAADFSHLRSVVHSEAQDPAVHAVARNAAKLQDDILGWIKVQELISAHLRGLTEISAASARAAQQ